MRWFTLRLLDRYLWLIVGVMTLALTEGHVAGQCTLDKLLASDGAANDQFGRSVSISDTPGNVVAIVGAQSDDDNGVDSGSAYVYSYDPILRVWVEEQKLTAFDGAAGDSFGRSVSISGDILVVGTPAGDGIVANSGAAYIYRHNGTTWLLEQKLLAFDGAFNDIFGGSVSINSDVVIVGSELDNENGTHSGSAYIYRFNGTIWIQEAKLLATDGAASDNFGESVSINGDVAFVGSDSSDGLVADSGSAYIYRFNGVNWIEEQKLFASDGALFDAFGGSVSISSDPGNELAIVGAYLHDDNGTSSGSAYIYRFNGVNWVEEAKLLASDGVADDFLGRSVSISGDIAIVGAFGDDDNGVDSGSAYVYSYNGANWVEVAKFLAPDGAADDQFGLSISLSDDVAIFGAFHDDDNGANSGSAHILTGLLLSGLSGDCNSNGFNDLHDLFVNKTSADCNDNGIPDECDITSGVSADVDVDGIPDECLASCPADNTGDGNVNVTDLLLLLAAWGACP